MVVPDNVLFEGGAGETLRRLRTSKLWVYDFRTGQHFTLRQNKLQTHHLVDFVMKYNPDDRHERTGSERFTYDELLARDKVNPDIT